MKILVLITLMASFAIFAKPNINYKYIPEKASLIGYISTKSLMKSKHYKKIANTKDGKKMIADLKSKGIDVKKLGSVFFYSNSDNLMNGNASKEDIKKIDAAIILNGLSIEKSVKAIVAKDKNAKTEDYNGFKIYTDIKLDDEDIDKDNPVNSVTFIKGNSVMGATHSVKSVIDTIKSKAFFKSSKLVNSLYSSLSNPDVFIVNIFNKKQKALVNKAVSENQANPAMAMLGVAPLAKSIKVIGFSSKLTGNNVKLAFVVKADKKDVKTFTTSLNMLLKQYKPMIMQQVSVYGAQLGKTGMTEIKSIINSVKIVQKKDLALVTLSFNLKNVMKVMKEVENKTNKQDKEMLRMMNRKK